MIVTTTPNIEGKRITQYLGIVTGEAILGANIFKDFFAGIRDIIGGRSAAYEAELRKAREIALEEIEREAHERGECGDRRRPRLRNGRKPIRDVDGHGQRYGRHHAVTAAHAGL